MRRKQMDLQAAREGRENTSTPLEMVKLLAALFKGNVLSKSMTDQFFKILKTNKESYLPRYLPEDVVVANKPGNLDGVRTDSGILFLKDRPVAISVMTTYVNDGRAAELAIGRIALAAYNCFDRLGRASEYGRVIPPKE